MKARSQAEHQHINADSYPGTREICINCGDPTGKAGKDDDSLYLYDEGPYCQDCYDQIKGDSR